MDKRVECATCHNSDCLGEPCPLTVDGAQIDRWAFEGLVAAVCNPVPIASSEKGRRVRLEFLAHPIEEAMRRAYNLGAKSSTSEQSKEAACAICLKPMGSGAWCAKEDGIKRHVECAYGRGSEANALRRRVEAMVKERKGLMAAVALAQVVDRAFPEGGKPGPGWQPLVDAIAVYRAALAGKGE